MATANPATLMNIGNGKGAALLGAQGIVAQAPFMPVATSLPVFTPLVMLQTMGTAMMMQLLGRKLDVIEKTPDKAIARAEATHTGELLAATGIVDEVYRQHEFEGQLSRDILTRLSLAERDVRILAVRFRQLVETSVSMDVEDLTEVQQANYDVHLSMLSSFLSIASCLLTGLYRYARKPEISRRLSRTVENQN